MRSQHLTEARDTPDGIQLPYFSTTTFRGGEGLEHQLAGELG
ncbi:hypothetical protein [Streptomyces sp. NPDC051561]